MTQPASCLIAADDGHSASVLHYAEGLAATLGLPLVVAAVPPGGPTQAAGALRVLAAHRHAAAVVIGPHVHGGVSAGLLRGAGCPVLVAPVPGLLGVPRLARIGVAYDGTPGSRHALAAAALARPGGTHLELLGVAREPRDAAALAGALRAAAASLGDLDVTVQLLSGRPGQQLRRAAEGLDLLCCGAHGRARRSWPQLGSVAAQLGTHPVCPVLIVPPPAAARPGRPRGRRAPVPLAPRRRRPATAAR